MKTLRLPFALLLLTGIFATAQEGALPAQPGRTPQELEQLVAPIALYPDALIALILPAAAASTDIVLAARYVRENQRDRTQIEHRAWDESVKSLTNYPEVIIWMDENLTWTKQIGEAFVAQPAEMMQAVQRLRAQARAAGTLVDTPQQQVLAEPNVIRIVPAQPDIIYVPYYDPAVVFVDRSPYYSYPRPYFTFGVGVAIGSWLAFDCDWRRNVIWVGNRHRAWHGHDWRQPLVSYAPVAPIHNHSHVVRQWRPSTSSHRPTVPAPTYRRAGIAQPAPISAVSGRAGDSRVSSSHFRPPQNNAVNPSTPNATPPQRSYSGNSRNGFVGPTAPTAVVAPPLPSANMAAPLAQTVPTPPPVTSRRNNPDATRTTPAQRSYSGGPRNAFTGPTAPTAVVAPPLPSANIAAPLAQTVPTPPPSVTSRRNNPDATRDNDSRNRGYRGNSSGAPVANTTAPATVPSTRPPAPAAYSPSPRAHPRAEAPTYVPQSRSAVASPPPPATVPSTAPAAAVASPAPATSSAPTQSAPAPAPDRRGSRRDATQHER